MKTTLALSLLAAKAAAEGHGNGHDHVCAPEHAAWNIIQNGDRLNGDMPGMHGIGSSATWEPIQWPGETSLTPAAAAQDNLCGDKAAVFVQDGGPWGGWTGVGLGTSEEPDAPLISMQGATHMCIEYAAGDGAVEDRWKIEVNDDGGNKAAWVQDVDISGDTALMELMIADMVANAAGDHGTGKTPFGEGEAGTVAWNLREVQIMSDGVVKTTPGNTYHLSNVWFQDGPCSKEQACCGVPECHTCTAAPKDCDEMMEFLMAGDGCACACSGSFLEGFPAPCTADELKAEDVAEPRCAAGANALGDEEDSAASVALMSFVAAMVALTAAF